MARRELSQRRLERREDAIWNRNLHLQDKNISAQYRDIDAADDIRQRTREKVGEILERAQSDAASSSAKIRAGYASKEKELLSSTRTALTGATRGRTHPLMVWHWKAVMPSALRERFEITRTDAGPILGLPPGGGMDATHSIPDLLVTEQPELLSDATFMEWAKTVASIWHGEVSQRYQILARLRDDGWFAGFAEAVGIHDPRKGEEPLRGRYGEYKRPVVLNVIPTISKVEIDEDGLVITFAHNAKASAKAWTARLDLMKNLWRSAGMRSDHLRLTDDPRTGGVAMRFGDAPSAFPLAIAPPVTTPVESVTEAKAQYKDFRWNLGVDARGNVIAPSIREVYHVLAVGGTGSGKSVWIRGLIESARLAGFRVYLGDGKMSDYPALENAPGVVMRSSDAAQHVVLIAEVHDEMVRRQAVAEERKRTGHPDPFDFDPILLVLDEFASMRSDVLAFCEDKKQAMEPWLKQIAAITRKGRELKAHLVLASQDLYVENIPNQWQANFQLLVALGEIEDKTLDTKFIPDNLRDEAKRVGSRITRKDRGRGLFVDKSDPSHIRITEFQSFYSYSPGSTSLSPDADADVAPPTDEVREVWEQQRDAAELMPRLYPRVGIKVEDPEWRDATVQELMSVPTVALDDAHGNPVASLRRYDHRTSDWIGRERIQVAVRGSAMPAEEPREVIPKRHPQPAIADSAPSVPALDLDSLTPAERDALLARLLSARVTAEDVSTDAPALTKSEESAPVISPEKPTTRTSAAQKGFSL